MINYIRINITVCVCHRFVVLCSSVVYWTLIRRFNIEQSVWTQRPRCVCCNSLIEQTSMHSRRNAYRPLIARIFQRTLLLARVWSRGAGGGSGPGGVFQHAMGQTAPPCEQNSWHTLLKILPCPNFVAGGNKTFRVFLLRKDCSHCTIATTIYLLQLMGCCVLVDDVTIATMWTLVLNPKQLISCEKKNFGRIHTMWTTLKGLFNYDFLWFLHCNKWVV